MAAAGCALKTPPPHDAVVAEALPKTTTIPPAWKAEPGAAPVTDDWLWTFDDPALEAIVAEAIANNLDLRQAADRVTMAQQGVVVVGARLLPQVGAQLGGRTTHDENHDQNFNTGLVYAGVAWEIDLWGKLRSQRAAAEAGYEATALDYAFARQSLATTVAKAWFLAIETRQLLALAEQSVDIYRKLADLVAIRRAAGKDSDLDVYDIARQARVRDERGRIGARVVRGGPPCARSAARALSRRGDRGGRDLPAPFGASADGRSREPPPAPTRRRRGRTGSARGFSPGRKPRDWRFCPISRSRSSAAASATSFSRCCA